MMKLCKGLFQAWTNQNAHLKRLFTLYILYLVVQCAGGLIGLAAPYPRYWHLVTWPRVIQSVYTGANEILSMVGGHDIYYCDMDV